MNQIFSFTFLYVFFISLTIVLSNLMSNGLLRRSHRNIPEIDKEINLKFKKHAIHNEVGNQQVKFEEWIKYLHYTDNELKKPKSFFKNSNFLIQEKSNVHNKKEKVYNIFFIII